MVLSEARDIPAKAPEVPVAVWAPYFSRRLREGEGFALPDTRYQGSRCARLVRSLAVVG